LPARRDQKRPTISWKTYQDHLPTENEVQAWFSNAQSALCILAGRVSGHLELIDFDLGGERFDPWCAKVRAAAPGLLERLVTSETQSGGRHVAYRCPSGITGNLKLAQRRLPDGQTVTLIETRGEGGLFLCAPTPGYTILQGDLGNLPSLSEDERDVLLSSAWELNECPPEVIDGPPRGTAGDAGDALPPGAAISAPAATGPTGGLLPGEDFSARGDMRAVLLKHGWTLAKPGENEYWRRPGKGDGWSATLKDRVFYVFSSNAAPLEPNKAYSPFAVYTKLEHAGKYPDAARALRLEGYGSDACDPDVDISAIVAKSTDRDEAPKDDSDLSDGDPIPEHLLRVPGFIAETADYSLATAKYGQPSLSFAAALALQALLAGRKIRDESDTRTNLYVLALANSGVGKDHPRKINQRILLEAGLDNCFGEYFASGEGIEDRLLTTPAVLFQTDEIDALVLAIAKGHDPRWEGIMSVLLRFYSNSGSVYPMRVKAGQCAGTIDQPLLCLLGTAIPANYYGEIGRASGRERV